MWQAVMFWLFLLSTGVKAGWQVWGINILLITERLHVRGKRYSVCHAKHIYNGWTNKSVCRVYNTNLACLHWLPINVICVITLWKCKHTSHCRYYVPRVVIKLHTTTPSLQTWLGWRFSSVINVHKLFDIPQKLIWLLRKNCGLDRHTELLEITGSHLRAVRKAVEYLSVSLGGWLHVVDTFASSKMCTDKLNMCENVCAACGKTPLLPLKRFPPPLKGDTMFSGPLSDERLLQQPVVNKLLGLDAQKTVTVCCAAASALQQN